MDKKLEVKNLQISFRTQGGILKAVRNISFDLYKGETFAIVGESGSGKSVTSKAVMGILAGNSIVEGGEILYDGQDLLKISEEDFHKIRGDKIAMIFQDPMSSLNPIMRVGQQLTEAMILKAKTGKRNAKNAFNSTLKLLADQTSLATNNSIANEVAEKAKTFDSFCIESTKIEEKYNECFGQATQLEVDSEHLCLLIKKNVKIDLLNEIKKIYKTLTLSIHPFVIPESSEINGYIADFQALIAKKKDIDANEALDLLVKVVKVAKAAVSKEKPNFFTLGYYMLRNPEADLTTMEIAEMNKLTRAYLDDEFMIDFIKTATNGVTYSHNQSIENKHALMPKLQEVISYVEKGDIDEKQIKAYAKELSDLVVKAIDRLEVKKNSVEYTFPSAISTSVKEYFDGIAKNPVEEKIYLKNKVKYDKLVAKGKTPDWILKPQVIVDLELKLGNIHKVLTNLLDDYNKSFTQHESFDAEAKVVEIIDYLKEQASRLVVTMNKRIAKAKAIKLLEEVGIPEPSVRYNKYPFELSGGMRQRVVIAIALSANPDILICDEPTTALDVTIQAQILELINVIKKQRNLSVIFITHNLGVVANMADRIGVMYAGKIVEYGTAEDIFYSPAHPYTWALLSSMPDLYTKERLESIPGTPPNMIYPPKGDAFAPRNKYALEIDFEVEPPLFELTDTHYAATWLVHPNAPKVEMPKIIQERIERMKKERE